MPIACRCPNCEKLYDLADKWAGRTTRCVACGQRFTVADGVGQAVRASTSKGGGEAGSTDSAVDWDLLSADIHSAASKSADSPFDDPYGETRLIKGAIRPVKRSGQASIASGNRPTPNLRRAPRGNPMIDRILPGSLCMVGYGAAALLALIGSFADPTFRLQTLVALLVLAALYASVVIPVSALGPVAASKIFNFQLPAGTLSRMFAIFALPTVVPLLLGVGLGVPRDDLRVIMPILSIPIFIVGIWLFYYMRWHEAFVAALVSFAALIAAGFVSVFLAVGIIGMFSFGGEEQQAAAALPWERSRRVEEQPIQPTRGGWPDRQRQNPQVTVVDPNTLRTPPDVDPIDYAIKQLGATEATRRQLAARSLSTMLADPTRTTEVIAALENRLGDPDAAVEKAAIEALMNWDEARALEAMKHNVTHETLMLRRQAIEALSERRMQSVARQVADLLPRDGHMVVQPLINFGNDAQRWVLPYLSHESPLTRRYAMEVIAEIGDREALPEILRLAEDADRTTAEVARRAMLRIAPDTYDKVTLALYDLESGAAADQLEAIETLMAFQPDDRRGVVSDALLPLVTGADEAVRQPAAAALARWHDNDTMDQLIGLLDESTDAPEARRGAMLALGKFADRPGAEAVARWIALEPGPAKAALIEMGEVAEPSMIDALTHRDPRANIVAAQVLGEIGTQRALKPLYSASQLRGDEQVRQAAKAAHEKVMRRYRQQQGE